MKISIQIIVGLLITNFALGQNQCDYAKLSNKDKILLTEFWTNFSQAVNANDKLMLGKLVKFPFNCNNCIIDTLHPTDAYSVKVTKKQFDSGQYRIFLDKKLKDLTTKYKLPKDNFIFTANYNTIDRQCTYSINYIVTVENGKHPGKQQWFDIEKIGGHFKITSTWTLP